MKACNRAAINNAAPHNPDGRLPKCIQSFFIRDTSRRAVMLTYNNNNICNITCLHRLKWVIRFYNPKANRTYKPREFYLFCSYQWIQVYAQISSHTSMDPSQECWYVMLETAANMFVQAHKRLFEEHHWKWNSQFN